MIDDDLRARRLALLEEHFRSEVDEEFDRTLATFAGHPRDEIIPTGQVYDGDEEVLAYHRNQRTAFPDQRHENVRHHLADDDTVVCEFDLLGTNLGPIYRWPRPAAPSACRSWRSSPSPGSHHQGAHLPRHRDPAPPDRSRGPPGRRPPSNSASPVDALWG